MGELILARTPIAMTPYYVEELGIHLYSLEELSFYIAYNTFLLTSAFENRELTSWIGRELHDRTLEKELNDLLNEDAPLHIFCGHILESNGLLTPYEMKETIRKISEIENKSEAECRKIRADSFRASGKLTDSIYEYENLINRKTELHIPIGLLGDIYHNLGTAYGRLFFFEEAKNCFRNAYERNHRQASLRSLLMTCLLEGNEKAFRSEVDHYLVPPNEVEEIRSMVASEERKLQEEKRSEQIQNEFIEDPTGKIVLSQAANKRLTGWKDEYIRQCRI